MDPDLAGFADAQGRLREAFAEPVVFIRPPELVWPSGTPIDPETGAPYDPTIDPVSWSDDTAEIPCDILTQPLTKDDVTWTALGATERDHAIFIAASGTASAASGASAVVARDEDYMVTSQKFDGVAGVQHFLTFGRKK